MHVSSRLFKTTALLLSSWDISTLTGLYSAVVSLLSLPKHLLDLLVLMTGDG